MNHPFLVVWFVLGGTNTKILGTESPKKALSVSLLLPDNEPKNQREDCKQGAY